MTNELIAKAVFGEITLGEIFKKFEKDIFVIHVENNEGVNLTNESWGISDDRLELYGEYEMDFSFDLNTKVTVRENYFEFEYEGTVFEIAFMSRINFDSLMPSAIKT